MESIIEQQRRYHEERERLIQAMVDVYLVKKKSAQEQILCDHQLSALLNHYFVSTNALKELYEDKDGDRKRELHSLSVNEFTEFYINLKKIKLFHKKYEINLPLSIEFKEFGKSYANKINYLFSDEEVLGKCIDLNECYDKYINLKGIEKIDYLSYLKTFEHFDDIPKKYKNAEYKKYCESLFEYLNNYIFRIKPLIDNYSILEKIEKEFIQQWDNGTFPGWPKMTENSGAHLDISEFSSWKELTLVGLERLKFALIALKLKCSGTLEERAKRLYFTKTKNEFDPSLIPLKAYIKDNSKEIARQRDIAKLEAFIYRFVAIISEQRVATIDNIQRKQARTEAERIDSSDDDLNESNSEDNANDDIPHNPKNIPVGWDGKPIPYWLYKLHGLNISYNCEICGNYTYKGPKAFQQHFIDWRHTHGMRCLGIKNTAHFTFCTKIEDALILWEILKTQTRDNLWSADYKEEFEDSQGNIVNKRTFDDLKRQGVL